MTSRYEYRVWAPDLTELAARLATHCDSIGVRVSEETYVVAPSTDLNIKIRSGILDIKELVRTQESFQLWTPIVKEAFPLSASAVSTVMAYLAETGPPAGRDEPLDVDDFLALAEGTGAATASVVKQRHGYRREGCILEFAEVTISGSVLHTVAVESEDLDTAIEVVGQLGIKNLPNRSYPMAIRQALRV